jgi:hypothetical protein
MSPVPQRAMPRRASMVFQTACMSNLATISETYMGS